MKRLCLAPALALCVFALPSFAADTTWTSVLSQTWNLGANWSSGSPPGSTAGAIFADSATIQHTLDIGANATTTIGIQFSLFSGGNGFNIMSSGTPVGLSLRAGGSFSGIINNDDNTQTFNVPLTFFSSIGSAGNPASQTFNASAGGLVISGIYSGSAPTITDNGGRLTVDGTFNTTIGSPTGRGDITGLNGLTKNGSGTLTLGGTVANSYSGSTFMNSGTLQLAKNNAVGNNSAIIFNGGTINAGSFNESMGALTLTNSTVVLDFGSPDVFNTIAFADSHNIAWGNVILEILNWRVGDTLKFGSTINGLSASQLPQIIFADFDGTPSAQIDSSGVVTPVPEPSAVALGLAGGFGLLATFIFRRNRK